MRIIFMGTPEFSVHALEEIIRSGYEVIAVYTQPPRPAGRGMKEQNSPVHQIALQHNIPVFTPKSLKSAEIQQEFINLNAQVAVVVAYGLLLPQVIIKSCMCVNIHASLLPRWRGAAPLQRAIMAGDKKTGITIIHMDEGLDTGDILLMHQVNIMPAMTVGHLHDELSGIGARLIVKALKQIEKGEITATKQQGESSYAAKISKEEAKIDWFLPGDKIILNIRAFNPHPGAYFEYKGEKIKILEADFIRDISVNDFGKIIDSDLTISCNGGTIMPQLVQRQGRKIMSINEMLNGFKFEVGASV